MIGAVTEPVKRLSGYVTSNGSKPDYEEPVDEVEFLIDENHYGVVPEPIPASRVLPDWYKATPSYAENDEPVQTNAPTVRRCAPFLDALSMGWVIPLTAQVEFGYDHEEGEFKWHSKMNGIIDRHSSEQLGPKFPVEAPILKFVNPWVIRVPRGYSMLFTPPLNRIETRFKPFSGVVDIDHYPNQVHFPFMLLDECLLEANTPVIQVIPFERESMLTTARVGPMSYEATRQMEQTVTRTNVRPSAYREEMWQAGKGTRVIREED